MKHKLLSPRFASFILILSDIITGVGHEGQAVGRGCHVGSEGQEDQKRI